MSAEERREADKAALRMSLLPRGEVADPDRPAAPQRMTSKDLLEIARAGYIANPIDYTTKQRYLGWTVFDASFDFPAIEHFERLAKLLTATSPPDLPAKQTDHPIPLALRRLRQAKTEEGKAKNEVLLQAAHLEMAIRKARDDGLEQPASGEVAKRLLRRVTSSS